MNTKIISPVTVQVLFSVCVCNGSLCYAALYAKHQQSCYRVTNVLCILLPRMLNHGHAAASRAQHSFSMISSNC